MSEIQKEIPIFQTEDEEREFWSQHDSTEYVDWGKAKVGAFPNLKPSFQKPREGWAEQIDEALKNGNDDGNELWEFD